MSEETRKAGVLIRFEPGDVSNRALPKQAYPCRAALLRQRHCCCGERLPSSSARFMLSLA